MARARPVNSEERQDRSATDSPLGQAGGASGGHPKQPSRPPATPGGVSGRHAARPAVPPDFRPTAVIPPVRDEVDPRWRDQVDVVKRALDGTPPPPKSPPPMPPRTGGGGGGGGG